jgi:hypothetical protein
MPSARTVASVWGETTGLKAKNGSDATLARLYAVVATLSAAAGKEQNFKKAPPPTVGDPTEPEFRLMQTTIDAIEQGSWSSAVALPTRAALWEVDQVGAPRLDGQIPPHAWFLENGVSRTGDYFTERGSSRNYYALFESRVPLQDGETRWNSRLTGTGLSFVRRRWYHNVNWWIGLFGGTLFFLSAFNLLWTATTYNEVYRRLTSAESSSSIQATTGQAPELQLMLDPPLCRTETTEAAGAFCITRDESLYTDNGQLKTGADFSSSLPKFYAKARVIGSGCVANLVRLFTSDRASIEKKEVPANRTESDSQIEAFCVAVVGNAVRFLGGADSRSNWQTRIGSWILGWQLPQSGESVSLVWPILLMIAGVVLVLIALGRGVTGTPLGALISPQNRYSLALAQVTFWTVLVLTSVGAIAIFNGGIISGLLRFFASSSDAAAAKSGFFPSIPQGIWLALGISFGSTVASKLINVLKGEGSVEQVPDATDQTAGIKFFRPLAPADPARLPTIADWFLGEDAANKDRIDITRIQMVIVTAALLVTYGDAILSSVAAISMPEILQTIGTFGVLVSTLPPVGTTMASMLALSHATYIAGKSAPRADGQS